MNTVLKATLLALFCSLPLVAQGAAEEGQPAPAVDLPAVGGAAGASLESLRGKVVYVDFWASWCGPCRVSFPILEALRTEFGAQGFEVLAISVDERESDAIGFLEEVPVSYPVVLDPTGATPSAYGVRGMPTGYLVDRAGIVRDIHEGFRKSDAEKLRAKITTLLGE